MAVYAGSGNVFTAFPTVEGAGETAIKAAVMYTALRTSASSGSICRCSTSESGSRPPPVNRRIGELAALAIRQNAPFTFLIIH